MVQKGAVVISSSSGRRGRTSSPVHCPARSSAEHRCQKSVKLFGEPNREAIPANQRGFNTDIRLLRKVCWLSESRSRRITCLSVVKTSGA